MKKILFLGGLRSGGAERQMVIIARLLKIDGYDVTYLSSGNSDFFLKDLEEVNIPVIRIKENKISSLLKLNIPRKTLLIRRILKKEKYDTVISFLSTYNFINCFYAKKKATSHRAITGIRNNRDSLFLAPRERFYTFFEKYCDVKVSNSDNAKHVFAGHFPHLASKLTTIYNIVDLPNITSNYSFRNNRKIHIIIPASYRAVKNPLRLLEALSLMNAEEQSLLHIDWYGNIDDGKVCYNEMIAFIDSKKINDVITLHDATKDIINKINEADAVGLFSTSEGLPNSICEGMMLGKPIVMTRVSDYDVLVDSSNGFLCDFDDSVSIKKSLISLASLSDEKIKEMGISSKAKATLLFSKGSVLNQWKQII
ncbi:MAG: glycosyltransferase [Bacteroidales bacterium]|nr:glycosyltransferase [Bacteroidales bacterium]